MPLSLETIETTQEVLEMIPHPHPDPSVTRKRGQHVTGKLLTTRERMLPFFVTVIC